MENSIINIYTIGGMSCGGCAAKGDITKEQFDQIQIKFKQNKIQNYDRHNYQYQYRSGE